MNHDFRLSADFASNLKFVAYRNQRDANLDRAGWHIRHISGAEFSRDPFGCVEAIYGEGAEMAVSVAGAREEVGE